MGDEIMPAWSGTPRVNPASAMREYKAGCGGSGKPVDYPWLDYAAAIRQQGNGSGDYGLPWSPHEGVGSDARASYGSYYGHHADGRYGYGGFYGDGGDHPGLPCANLPSHPGYAAHLEACAEHRSICRPHPSRYAAYGYGYGSEDHPRGRDTSSASRYTSIAARAAAECDAVMDLRRPSPAAAYAAASGGHA